jgi:squalene-hopene/tetraprenyl-beta-curcumene cyclase
VTRPPSPRTPPDERTAAWLEEVAGSIERGWCRLREQQQPDGHWVGELEGDTILESEFILLLAILRKFDDPRIRRAANYLRQHQLADGGWANYPGGPAEVSVSVKAYFALKIAGYAEEEPFMQRAAEVIRSLGGAEATNSFTRFYLALLGQVPYSACPSVPVEIILLPRWFVFSIYAMSAWSRTIFVPLSIVDAHKPVTRLPESMHVRELFLEPPETPHWPAKPTNSWFSWTNLFLGIDWLIKRVEKIGLRPLRGFATRRALAWIRERAQESDGLGAIFPPMVYHAIVLRCLGVPDDDPEMRWVLKQLDDLCLFEGDTLRLQPCLSPVWDTALSLIAAADAGDDSGAVSRAATWLLDREVRTRGDWSKSVRGVEPGGWCFEYRNGFYPDTDDTSMVLLALGRGGQARQAAAKPAVRRAIDWLLAMQNSDGGWAAFDRDINKEFLTKVPFADHNAMLDPSCPDITARVVEALAHHGYHTGHPTIDRAVSFILTHQEENGSWFGRWGVNYIYGTWQVLVGLAVAGFDMDSRPVRRAVRWFRHVQNADGGWGESCRSYDDASIAGQGPSTASQTAWAVLGLLAAGEWHSEELRAGVEYLVGTQTADGLWTEDAFTGTGFPRVFYLKYHMYSQYFPLMALSRYRTAVGLTHSMDVSSQYRIDRGHESHRRTARAINAGSDRSTNVRS